VPDTSYHFVPCHENTYLCLVLAPDGRRYFLCGRCKAEADIPASVDQAELKTRANTFVSDHRDCPPSNPERITAIPRA